jgi:hypothetical protein
VEREATETPNLNPLSGRKGLCHVVNQQFDRQFDVFCAQLALTIGHQVNQFASRHASTPVSSAAILADTSRVGKSLILIRFIDLPPVLLRAKKKAGKSRPHRL